MQSLRVTLYLFNKTKVPRFKNHDYYLPDNLVTQLILARFWVCVITIAMINALIFDFDGLIFDSETADFQSWQETFDFYGADLPFDIWAAQIGSANHFNPTEFLEQQLGRPVNRDEVHTRRKQRDNELLAQQGIMPGVEAYLAEAKALGMRVGLASSSPHSWIDHHLEKLGLTHWFEVVCCRDDVGDKPKPEPDVYLAAVAALGVPPNRSMALEDSPNGVLAAKRAGMWVTAVPNQMTRPLDFDQADIKLTSLTDMTLTQLIKKHFS